MIPGRYNPVDVAMRQISAALTSIYQLEKEAAVYFDGRLFISNASIQSQRDVPDIEDIGLSHMISGAAINSKNMLTLTPSRAWIHRSIEDLPKQEEMIICDDYQGFIERLNAHLHFGFYEALWQDDAYDLALMLLRLLNVKSPSLREDIIHHLIQRYDQITRSKRVPKPLISALKRGIIWVLND